MTLGGISMDAPSQAALGVLKSAMSTQASAVSKLLDSGPLGSSGQMMQSAMAEQGKGLKLDLMV